MGYGTSPLSLLVPLLTLSQNKTLSDDYDRILEMVSLLPPQLPLELHLNLTKIQPSPARRVLVAA